MIQLLINFCIICGVGLAGVGAFTLLQKNNPKVIDNAKNTLKGAMAKGGDPKIKIYIVLGVAAVLAVIWTFIV